MSESSEGGMTCISVVLDTAPRRGLTFTKVTRALFTGASCVGTQRDRGIDQTP